MAPFNNICTLDDQLCNKQWLYRVFCEKFYRVVLLFLMVGIQQQICYARRYLRPKLIYTSDLASNLCGGDERSIHGMGLLNAGMMLNGDSTGWWKGGLFNFEINSTQGRGISSSTLHDKQMISNIEAGNHPLLMWELWVHQQIGALGIRVGLQNINDDFMVQPYTKAFSSSSFDAFPTFTLNYSLPNYPLSGLGVSVGYRFSPRLVLMSAMFNGRVSNLRDDPFNVKWRLDPRNDGVMTMSELKYSSAPTARLQSTYAVGGSYHNKTFDAITGDRKYRGNFVVYGFAEHDFYRNGNKNVGVFVQASYAPKNRNIGYGYFSMGIMANGFITRGQQDKLGVALCRLNFQEQSEDNDLKLCVENAVEAFAMFHLSRWLAVKPTTYAIVSTKKPTTMVLMTRLVVTIF